MAIPKYLKRIKRYGAQEAQRRAHLFVLALVVLIAELLVVSPVIAQEPGVLSVQEIERLHEMLRPQPGESRWMEIDWYPSIWEARQKAAEEGKPIFIMAASGGAPPAGC